MIKLHDRDLVTINLLLSKLIIMFSALIKLLQTERKVLTRRFQRKSDDFNFLFFFYPPAANSQHQGNEADASRPRSGRVEGWLQTAQVPAVRGRGRACALPGRSDGGSGNGGQPGCYS